MYNVFPRLIYKKKKKKKKCLNGQIFDNQSLSIRLNLVNIESKIRKPTLIINTICIWVNLGNVQGTFFCGILQELMTTGYKTIKPQNLFVRSEGEDGGGDGGVLNLSFELSRGVMGLPKLNKCKQ